MWKDQMKVASLEGGETQPFYHCAWDKRDRPDSHVGFVAEENLDACEGIFPIQAPWVESLLVPCDALGGYFLGRRLELKLRQQCMNGVFFDIFR
jgi:hemimethylated DNA binding protein